MSQEVPPPPGPTPPPPPPPSIPPVPQAPPPASQRTAMLILAYLGLLALIPLIVSKDDREVQWHARHGLVLTVAFVALWMVISVLTFIAGFFVFLHPLVYLAWLVLTVLEILKAVNGQRLLIPGISEFADKF